MVVIRYMNPVNIKNYDKSYYTTKDINKIVFSSFFLTNLLRVENYSVILYIFPKQYILLFYDVLDASKPSFSPVRPRHGIMIEVDLNAQRRHGVVKLCYHVARVVILIYILSRRFTPRIYR